MSRETGPGTRSAARDATERWEGEWGGSDIQAGEDPPYMTVTLTVRKH